MHSGRKIFESTSVISVFTGISRLLGLVREILMARFFGTSLARSAFDIAFRIPNLFRAILGEGALNAAFVPLFTEALEKEGEEGAHKLAASIFTLVGSILLLIVGVGTLILLTLSSFDLGGKCNAVVSLACVTLPYVFFICLAALCMGVFHSRGKFWVPAASQGLLNIVWIAVLCGMFFFPILGSTPSQRIYAVAWSIIVAGAAQLAFQSFFLRRQGFNPRLSFDWADDRVKRFRRLMLPVVLGSGVTQLNVFVSSILALSIGEWAPAALGYADRLIYLPVGMFATALGSVLLPTFSRQAANDRKDDLIKMLNGAIRNICIVMTPVAAVTLALALPIVTLVFRAGEFDEHSAMLTSRALLAYVPGFIVFGIYKVVVPAFYGMQDTKTPVVIAFCSTLLNLALNILSVMFLPDGYQHAGLAGSNVLSSLFASIALLVVLNRKVGGLGFVRTAWSMVSTLISGLIMGVATYRTYSFVTGRWFNVIDGGKFHEFGAVSVSAMAGLLVYIAARLAISREGTLDVARAIVTRGKK
jgi:putative peptidoglycan lipid II flippase